MAFFCSLKWECKQCSQHSVSLYCFNGELNLGVMATCVSDLGSKIVFLKIWKVELRGTFQFLEGSCVIESRDAVYTGAPCSLPASFWGATCWGCEGIYPSPLLLYQ